MLVVQNLSFGNYTDFGAVFTWGRGAEGQLGHDNTDEKDLPTLVSGLNGRKVVYADVGDASSYVVTSVFWFRIISSFHYTQSCCLLTG